MKIFLHKYLQNDRRVYEKIYYEADTCKLKKNYRIMEKLSSE